MQTAPAYMPPQMPQTMQQPSGGLNRVTGQDGARAFTMPPNTVAALFDDTRDVFYIKTTDSGGFPTLKAYRFTPMEDEPSSKPEAAPSMTREEIQKMVREEIDTYGKQLISAISPAGGRAEQSGEPPAAVPAVRKNDAGARPAADA